ncbi:MAG TPA: hypothetical protein VKQ52_08965 [Puia sp.]|nr:hypothetical protein [Puia sp.]
MIQFHELRIGDIVLVEFDGQRREGEVTGLNAPDKEIQVENEVQEFWYTPEDLYPIPLDDEQLLKFGFEKQDLPDGKVKYLKGPFRILLSGKGNFSDFEMWYREDRRHMTQPIAVHNLQNHFHGMTKIDLVRVGQEH